ncbi:MAG TPA: RdgB/HAM1 family non-canonical purine NTP pyrophosphatase [Sediminibacterium sp.]|nr:RdgB/HAM1 family non-canonical purine NTP pyrophosphatase [Sediminibacterium sp.]
MKPVLLFATNNTHKADEIRSVPNLPFRILTLQEAGIHIDIPEPHPTLEANATEKSTTIYRLTGNDCFSEDTGLEVKALQGEPGVKSARYAGEGRKSSDNIHLLLSRLNGQTDRSARFRTVISLLLQGKEYQFEGICTGTILFEPTGSGGFGYDPVFVPDGATNSFAEMNTGEKNKYSHRKKALDKLLQFLTAQISK